MKPLIRKIIAVLAAAFILSVAYYGTYLPMRKSQIFISTLKGLRSAKTIEDLVRALSVPLDAPSPIGQEELVRNTSNIFLNLVQQNDKPDVVSASINFVENHYRPIIDRGRGMSFEQNLYILGVINETAFIKTKEIRYLEAAKNYYIQGSRLGPKRPQFLYGLFDIYRAVGDVENTKKIGEQILSQWPDDERTSKGLSDFLGKTLTNSK